MTSEGPAVQPGIMAITPYMGGESSLQGAAKVIKLASNEGAFGPSPAAMKAFEQASRTLHRYPDGHCMALREALGRRYGLDPERIVCGAGSDELLVLLCHAYAGPGDEVLYSAHGFLMYPISARSAGATPVAAPEKNLTADVDALLARVTPRTRVLFIANPNNPTGSYLTADALQSLRDGLPRHVLLVIDAAYAEFVERNDYSDGVALVDAGDNTVVTRTFSKIFGLGGLRIGWAFCPPAVADVLNRVRNPFNVASPAQAAAIAALGDIAFVERGRAHNTQWRDWLSTVLDAKGLTVAPSVANFVLVRFARPPGRDAAAADAFLRQRGIIVRRMDSYGLPDSLRITIGLEDEVRAAAQALADFQDSIP